MKNEKAIQVFNIIFLVFGVITFFEHWFVFGGFTGVLMFFLMTLVGILTVIVNAVNKKYYNAILFALTTISLVYGYAEVIYGI